MVRQIAVKGIGPFLFQRHAFLPIRELGRVVRKPVNVNPGLNVNWSIIFSCLKMFFTSYVWFSLRLQLKTQGQTM